MPERHEPNGAKTEVELRHLRYFVALAGEMHFGRAAAALRITQPLLSRQIRQLEKILGLTLLERTRPVVVLSPAGKDFSAHAQNLLQETEKAIRSAQRTERGREILKIAFEPCSVFHNVAGLVRSLTKVLPDVQFELLDLPVTEHGHALRTGRIDIAYAHRNEELNGIEFKPLTQEPVLLALSAEHPLKPKKKISPADLVQDPFIFWPRSLAPKCHDGILTVLASYGPVPKAKHQATDHRKALELVAGGAGWTVVAACARRASRGGVFFRSLPGVHLEVGISRLKGTFRTPVNTAVRVWQELANVFA
jgi:DNA-binding transcriptional LysR family regulator